jgi:1-acyl-sn-glycerol-3-phosphate acyltransferase
VSAVEAVRSTGHGSSLAPLARRALWRSVLAATGGLTVRGTLPTGGCVVVANHSSHADTAALIAALPAGSRPLVAAAADYWQTGTARRIACTSLVEVLPVRRGGGGWDDLAAARAALADGRAVVVFPEGTRSRDGVVGAFHSGAFRLAASAGVPVVPVGLAGTGRLLPVHGRPSYASVAVRIGTPVPPGDVDAARAAVVELSAAPADRADSRLRRGVARFASSPVGLLAVAVWAVAEALSWPLVPELLLAVLAVAAPRRAVVLAVTAAAASLAGGVLAVQLAAGGVQVPQPLVTDRMRVTVAAQTAADGAGAVVHQPLSGVPYKVYAAAAGRDHVSVPVFVAASARGRGLRIVLVGLACGLLGAALRRLRALYPAYLVVLLSGFAVGLARVVAAWS